MDNHSRLNRIFRTMKNRCYNPKAINYKDYGARGITVCDEWNDRTMLHSGVHGGFSKGWLAFKKWSEENGYREGLTLDRINVNEEYSPENCRWISQKEQCNNTRRNIVITYNSHTYTLPQWCEKLGLNYCKTYRRLYDGWSVEKAFTTK